MIQKKINKKDQQQNMLKNLANQLSEELNDKTIQLNVMRQEKKLLYQKIQKLQATLDQNQKKQ